jgi:cobalt-zinc-cadmium resistance protein CzcA
MYFRHTLKIYDRCFKLRKLVFGFSIFCLLAGILSFKLLGTEFLPTLDEGSIYVRATGPLSISLDETKKLSNEMRKVFLGFDEVKQVLSQTGRPNDGTDATGFYNMEFHVDIHPRKGFPGISLNFSQPISDNVEEAVSGVKGSIVVKLFGNDFHVIEREEEKIYDILKDITGIEDLGILRNLGQPELQINLNQKKMALYGITTADANAVIEMAIGGKAATEIFEGERKFDLIIRYPEEFRNDENAIGKLMIPTISGGKVPLGEVSEIIKITGPSMIYRDKHERYGAIKFSIRGRDMGSVISEAQAKVKEHIKLDDGYKLEWAGDFENQQRASARLVQAVPVSLLLIFLILFVLFGNIRDSLLVLNNVPFAMVGGILALLATGINFNISAGIGFIALFGICVQNGVILITRFKTNIANLKYQPEWTFIDAIRDGLETRIRPVIMTALMAAIGLLPAALSTGIGSEASKPLAVVVIGGLITNTLFNLFVYPTIVYWVYRPGKLEEAN